MDTRATETQPPTQFSLAGESADGFGQGGHRASHLQRGDTVMGQHGVTLGAQAGSVLCPAQEHHSLPCRQVTGTSIPLPALQCLFFLTSGPVCTPAQREKEGSRGKVPHPQLLVPQDTHIPTVHHEAPGAQAASCSDTQSSGQPTLAFFTHLQLSWLFVQKCSHPPTSTLLFSP